VTTNNNVLVNQGRRSALIDARLVREQSRGSSRREGRKAASPAVHRSGERRETSSRRTSAPDESVGVEKAGPHKVPAFVSCTRGTKPRCKLTRARRAPTP
jgi:hypothetical protein